MTTATTSSRPRRRVRRKRRSEGPSADETSWTSLSRYIVPRTYPWCGIYKGQHRAKRIGKRRKVCRYCRKRDCANPCGARREAEWFDEGRAHLRAMRPYGPFFLLEAGANWGQLQRKYLRGTHWWHRSIPTPFSRRAIINCPDISGAVRVDDSWAEFELALSWVSEEFDLGPNYADGRKGKRPRDNFDRLHEIAQAPRLSLQRRPRT